MMETAKICCAGTSEIDGIGQVKTGRKGTGAELSLTELNWAELS